MVTHPGAPPASAREPGGAGVAVGPVPPSERWLVLDVVRGFALLGILVVNMDAFASPVYLPRLGWADSGGLADRLAGVAIRLLFEGKFYTLFSMLFGLGLAVQMARLEARGARFVPLYLRRLLALLAFGAAHAVLLWYGDILLIYALLGFPLLLFRRARPKALLAAAVVCLLLPIAMDLVLAAVLSGAVRLPVGHVLLVEAIGAVAFDAGARIEAAVRAYGSGSFVDMVAQRVADLKFSYLIGLTSMPVIFGMFLLGLYVGRRGIAADLDRHGPMLRKVAGWGLALGVAGNVVYVAVGDLAGDASIWADVVARAAHTLGAPVLMLGYAASVALLLRRPTWCARLARLAPIGRMALTSYLTQTVICTTIFNGYGLGLYGRVGLAAGLVFVPPIYLAQMAISARWVRRFSYGPMEWLWRSLTYGRPPRRDASGLQVSTTSR